MTNKEAGGKPPLVDRTPPLIWEMPREEHSPACLYIGQEVLPATQSTYPSNTTPPHHLITMPLQDLMITLISTFDKYAKGDGDSSTLSQNELFELAKKEFPALCQSEKKDEILKGVIGQMDMDGDNKVNFKEFVIFISCLTIALKENIKM
ncbi:protein S100-A5-like [Rhinoderma darwinii]|uniref:protein S100-A5-like n=1 Tax=Rhinoderma darwinii TaxID=43563 RepID=UPI003F663C33